MASNRELLQELQALELRLKELEAEIAALPRRVLQIESKLNQSAQAVERARAGVGANQSQRRQLEREIEDLRAKISKVRGHSAEVKTNQEYKALLDEVAFAEAEIGKREEQILRALEEQEALEAAVREQETALTALRAGIQAETATAAAQTAADKQERERLTGRRTQLRPQVDAAWLARFDRVLRLRGQALASIDREACGSCRVRLRPQLLQEISARPDDLAVCESCGRILLVASQPVAAATE